MNDLFETSQDHEQQPLRDRRAHRRELRRARRRRRIRTFIVLTVTVAVVVGLGLWAYPRVRDMVTAGPTVETDYPGPGHGQVEVTIPDGATGREIATLLSEEDVVATPGAFVDAFDDNANASLIQPGTYTLRQEMAAADAVAALLDPANRAEVTITVPEGFTTWQVYERIAAVAGVSLEEVEAAAEDTEAIGLPEAADGDPEGWYAPATYSFEPDDDVTTMLSAMIDQTVERLDEREVPEDERDRVLTIASIVEREVNLPEYHAQVARVILNRLDDRGGETNRRLQMDSTVLYGNGEVGGIPTQRQLRDEENPYNTYENPGLPPTPIGSPGTAVIDAVLDPAEGDWLYFVTVNLDTGETLFASTRAEQQENVERLREWCEQNPDSCGDSEG
ncbi:endolytic transglycosylase MltG [Georgenia deserti]|uniref:Endolytic murein transglycosylase n=1 Tax=Georgenia deserti TaxID=2093781 RepID=A0ABW4L6J0_9MICO